MAIPSGITMKVVVAGANGNLGRRLIGALGNAHQVLALVRSPAAAEHLIALPCQVAIVGYQDVERLSALIEDFDVLINLTGIIKASRLNTYVKAHEEVARGLVAACQRAGVERLIALGICGSDEEAANACFRSRAACERIQLEGSQDAVILRVPMVLGEGDFASAALIRNAVSRLAFTFRASSLEQPIYAGDVIAAIEQLLGSPVRGIITLAGPESLPRKQLITRCAALIENDANRVVSLPMALGLGIAFVLERLMRSPPVTRAMLGVLDHDDHFDEPVPSELELTLTPLDVMLKRVAESVT